MPASGIGETPAMTGRGLTLLLDGDAQTTRLGAALAPLLEAGDAVLLSGAVGAGKSHLARAIIRARLGRMEDVPSPTFTLVQTYEAGAAEVENPRAGGAAAGRAKAGRPETGLSAPRGPGTPEAGGAATGGEAGEAAAQGPQARTAGMDAGGTAAQGPQAGAAGTAAVEIWHADLYRLTSPAEVAELGLEAAFETAICLVEWPDRLGRLAPPDALEIALAVRGDARAAHVRGGRAGLIDGLEAAWGLDG